MFLMRNIESRTLDFKFSGLTNWVNDTALTDVADRRAVSFLRRI